MWKETSGIGTREDDARIISELNKESCKTACINEKTFACMHAEFGQITNEPMIDGRCYLGRLSLIESSVYLLDGLRVYEPREEPFRPG